MLAPLFDCVPFRKKKIIDTLIIAFIRRFEHF